MTTPQPHCSHRRASRCLGVLLVCAVVAGLSVSGGCRKSRTRKKQVALNPALLMPLNLDQPARPTAAPGGLRLSAAKNETVGFALQVTGLPPAGTKDTRRLRVVALAGSQTLADAAGWQILPMPVDLNRAGYVRQTGLTIEVPTLPSALLPLAGDGGVIDLSGLRDPNQPTAASARAGGPGNDTAQLWIDLHLGKDAPAGSYAARCELIDQNDTPLAVVEMKLTVYDFSIPEDRHLHLISPLEWDRLVALYADRFEAVRPNLLNRHDKDYAAAIRTLDQLHTLAHKHRCQLTVPRLGPRVKWPPGQQPEVDWEDFVGIVGPWMSGVMFADKVPLGFWPIPQPEMLPQFDRQSQLDYWANAARRFDALDWLPQSAVLVEALRPGRVGAAGSIELSALAAQLLATHARLRVAVPLEEDQVVLSSLGRPNMVVPRSAGRLLCSAPGLVFAPPLQSWPGDVPRPRRWLRTDLPGLVPYLGAERDVQLFAWLAYLREADLILWPGSLPRTNHSNDFANPNDSVWFYPGHWFGVDEPLPTLQLKWLRRAQQDYEYLWLTRSRGEKTEALMMARVITKPVQTVSTQSPDPVYALLSGTADPKTWSQIKTLLARYILLRSGGGPADNEARKQLNLDLLHALEPQDRQFQLARTVQYLFDRADGAKLTMRLGLDLYNASDEKPAQNLLAWNTLPPGWTFRPQPLALPSLSTFNITQPTLDAWMRLDRLGVEPDGTTAQPAEWTFTNGDTRRTYPMRAVIPVAPIDRRTKPLDIDGSLGDWDSADTIQNGPLVRMIDRPSLQRQQIVFAPRESRLYGAFADQHLYLAFRLGGATESAYGAAQNFVSYQLRRAWGEDLCELLIQPQYADNTLGPVMHVVCKTTGSIWVEKKLDPRTHADPWVVIEGSPMRYAKTLDNGIWRGELAVPWKALLDEHKGFPVLLRFNMTQHVGASGESATWAGPVDYGRDDAFMGALYLRDPDMLGMPRQTTITEGRR